MLKIGITGGIGSGKTIVCQVFETLGIPVFYADQAAKFLMENNADVKTAISKLIGDQAYTDGHLNTKAIAALVFNNPKMLKQLNQIVHPAVTAYGREWVKQQNAPYVIKEAALFFESKTDKEMDYIIGVFAPESIRIQRAMKRDGLTESEIRKRMANQMKEEDKMIRCHQVIVNDDSCAVLPQVLYFHQQLLNGKLR